MNKTQIIDKCIQELFKNGFTYLYHGRGINKITSDSVIAFITFQQRMRNEHQYVTYSFKKVCEYGICVIKLL